MPDWHDASCSRPDFANFGGVTTCLSCGSVQAEEQSPPPDKDCPYKYSPIEQRSEIRVLSIEPGEFDEPVRGQLIRNVNGVEYDALSYTWADENGDKEQNNKAHINNRVIQVTANCELALKRLRHRFSKRNVWVDAICIDQKNLAERGHQVDLMPQIYSTATGVYIYIGEERDDSSLFLHYLATGEIPTEVFEVKEAFYKLIGRPYFSRIWVLQEVALAKRAWLICGSTVVPWSLLQDNNTYYRKLLGQATDPTFTSSWDAPPILPNKSRFPPVLHFNRRNLVGAEQILCLLDLSMPCEASDPRDKVYALFGLLAGGQGTSLVADYTITVPYLYKKIAKDIAKTFGPLQAIRRVGNGKLRADLPSWVPDWTAPGPAFPGPWTQLEAFAPKSMRTSFDKDGELFPEIIGFEVGPIKTLMEERMHPFTPLRVMLVDPSDRLEGHEVLYQPFDNFDSTEAIHCPRCNTSRMTVEYGYSGISTTSFPPVVVYHPPVKYGIILRHVGSVKLNSRTADSARYVGLVRYKNPRNCLVRNEPCQCEPGDTPLCKYDWNSPGRIWKTQLETICLV